MTWEEFWQKIVNFFNSNIWNIIWFFTILAAGFILIPLLLFIMKRILRRHHVDEIAIRFVATIVRFLLVLLWILILLAVLGVPITGLTSAIAAAVLAVGMALKEFLSNIASGIVLIGSHKFSKGDYIQVKSMNVEGNIEDMNLLFATLHTPDNTQVTVPNNSLVNGAVVNLHAYTTRRVAISFPVDYASDTKVVKETLINVALSCGLIHTDPKPLCRLKSLGDSSLEYWLTCYCDKEDYWDAYFYIMDYGYDSLKAAGVNIPFPQVTVSQRQEVPAPLEHDGKLPERVEKQRVEVRRKKMSLEDLEDKGFDAMKEEAERAKAERELEKAKRAAKKKEEAEKKKAAKKKDE